MPGQKDRILTVNAGSSSLKFAVFDLGLARLVSGIVSEIGGHGRLTLAGESTAIDCPSHEAALRVVFDRLADSGFGTDRLRAVGHRVAHGGAELTQPTTVTSDVTAEIGRCCVLAPLHNPVELACIEAIAEMLPDLLQIACFDTAFHAGNPPVATHYALPPDYWARGFRRFGFHGLSYSSIVHTLPTLTGASLPQRLLAFHLGNGASECAIRGGRSVATTMGYSPLEGLTMGTRAGSIDGNAVLRLAGELGIVEAGRLLNQESGLFGLSGGISNMAELIGSPDPRAKFAVEHFCYWAVRHAGSMIAAMGGLDAIVFTGGIGEHASAVRSEIAGGLRWLGVEIDEARNGAGERQLDAAGSRVPIWIVPADEQREIARHVAQLSAD
jgi:acetate kinase